MRKCTQTTNSGNYPSNTTSLTGATPPYVNENYCGRTISGFEYTCAWGTSAYTFTATPAVVGTSGTTTYTITTGGILAP
jgi:hypothetical protein